MPRPEAAQAVAARNGSDSGPRRLEALTGLRFVAALAVFAFHAGPLLPGWAWLGPLLAGGQSGVSFFFVLSGFVLTWSASTSSVPARVFWRRRAARILPTYWVAWLVGIPVTWMAFGAWPSVGAMVTTGTLSQAWFDDKSYYFGVNGVGWSLSCEVLFYALFPVLITRVRRWGRRGVGVVGWGGPAVLAAVDLTGLLVGGSTAADPAGSTFWWVSVLPVSRVPEFVLGMVAARAVSLGVGPVVPLRWATLGAVCAVYLAGLFPAAAVAGALTAGPFAMVIHSAATAELSGRAGPMSSKPWVRLGTWSFAFYLTHQLVLRLSEWLWPATGAPGLHLLVDAGAAVVVAGGLYRFLERPAERRWRAQPKADVLAPAPTPAPRQVSDRPFEKWPSGAEVDQGEPGGSQDGAFPPPVEQPTGRAPTP